MLFRRSTPANLPALLDQAAHAAAARAEAAKENVTSLAEAIRRENEVAALEDSKSDAADQAAAILANAGW